MLVTKVALLQTFRSMMIFNLFFFFYAWNSGASSSFWLVTDKLFWLCRKTRKVWNCSTLPLPKLATQAKLVFFSLQILSMVLGFSVVFFYTTLKIAITFSGCHWNGCCCFRILQGGQNIRLELQGRCKLFVI